MGIRDLLVKFISYARVKNIAIDENKDAASESYDVIGSNRKLTLLTGWKPQIAIEQSLRNTLDYYRNILPVKKTR